MAINQSSYAVPRLDIGGALVEWMADQSMFVGTQLFPVFGSAIEAGTYSAITRESILSLPDSKRGARGTYNRIDLGAKDKTFACEENGFEVPIYDRERAKYRNDFDAVFTASKIAMTKLLLKQEQRIASLAQSTSTFTGSALYTDVSSAPWDAVGSDLLGQVRTAIEAVRANCGMPANTVVMSKVNLNRVLANTAVVDRIKYTARATDAEIMRALADLFGVSKVLIGNGVYNSANEGQAFSSADIWSDDYVLVAVTANDGNDLSQPSVGRTFLWVEDSESNSVAETYRDETARAEIVRVRHNTDEQIVDQFFAHLLKVDA